ncbi:MAG: energy transducer TonB [Bacteroidia bacterium]
MSKPSNIQRADLTDMVFEDRSRSYGAYRLRKLYDQRLLLATFVGLGLFFAGITAPNLMKAEPVVEIKKAHPIFCEDCLKNVEKLKEDKPDPIIHPPRIEPPKPPATVAFRIPEPTPEDQIEPETEPTMPDMNQLANANMLGLDDIDGEALEYIEIPDETGNGAPSVIETQAPKEPGLEDFIFASQEPAAINMDDIKELIGYPAVAREANIQGTVIVRILIDEYGEYRRHKVIKKSHPILAQAVEKRIARLKFTPALQGKKAIMFWVNVPFTFALLD